MSDTQQIKLANRGKLGNVGKQGFWGRKEAIPTNLGVLRVEKQTKGHQAAFAEIQLNK